MLLLLSQKDSDCSSFVSVSLASLQLARGESNLKMSGNRNWPSMFLRKPSASSGQGKSISFQNVLFLISISLL